MAGTVQQCVLVSTMRTRDGSRRNKPRKAWCRRSRRGTKGLINASRVFVVATLIYFMITYIATLLRLLGCYRAPAMFCNVAHIIFVLQKGHRNKQQFAFLNASLFFSNLLRMRTHISNKFLSFLPLLTLLQACL